MKYRTAIVERLRLTAEKLGDLTNEFVFVGGSVAPLLVTDEAAPDARPTRDVDVIARVLRKVDYYSLNQRLAKVGFLVTMGEDVICRFRNGDLILDVMPTAEDVLGFSNKWYEAAFANAFPYKLSNECQINVVAAPFFLCTKLEAYQERGKHDEKDLEDVLYIVDGRPELLQELRAAPSEVGSFVGASINSLIERGLLSKLDWYLAQDAVSVARMPLVSSRLNEIAALAD